MGVEATSFLTIDVGMADVSVLLMKSNEPKELRPFGVMTRQEQQGRSALRLRQTHKR